MKILISSIKSKASSRPEGYIEDVLSQGVVEGDFLIIDPPKYKLLLDKYANTYATSSIKGAGDVVYKVAQPIAKVLDKALGTNIAGCGGCKKRREWLNKNIPFNQ